MKHFASSFALSLLLVACGNGDATISPDAQAPDASADVTAADSAPDAPNAPHDAGFDATDAGDADAADGSDANTGVTFVRFANLSTDAPALDVCVAGSGGFGTVKPLYGSMLANGLAFAQVTKFTALTAGAYAFRFVAAGATDCNTPVGGATIPGVTLGNNAYTTILARGQAAGADASTVFALKTFADDPPYAAHLDAGANAYSAIRVLNEADGLGAIDVGRGALATNDFQMLFPAVPFDGTAAANAQTAIDALGYMNPLELQGDLLSAHAVGATTDLARWTNVAVDLGEVATFFLVRDAQQGGVRALLCARDYAAPPNAVLNNTCAFLP